MSASGYLRRFAGAAAFAASAMLALPSGAKPPIYYGTEGMPFSEAVQVGDMLYLSGQIGVEPGKTSVVPGGIEAEARQTMDNIGAVLKRRGLGFGAIVKCTVMLADMKDWPAFNTVYVSYFKPGKLPARSAFGSTGLAYGGRIELECWAHNPVRQPKR